MTRWVAVLGAALVAAACQDTGGPVQVALRPALEIVTGDGQVDTVARTLAAPIVARVRDSATGQPARGILVNWVVVAGGGQVFAGAVLTNDSGAARQVWTLGPAAGVQRLEARAMDPATGQPVTYAQVTATALPGPAASFALAVTDSTVATTQRVAVSPLVRDVRDAYGNPVAGASVSVLPGPGWYGRGDTVWADAEHRGTLAVQVGSATRLLHLVALHDLRRWAWSVGWVCRDAPTRMRDVEQPAAGLDSLRAELTAQAVYAGDLGYDYPVGGRVQWRAVGSLHRYWGDGVADTVPEAVLLVVDRQVPDTVTLRGYAPSVTAGMPPAYAVGAGCQADFRGPSDSLRVRGR